uniref:ethanolamine kinase n=1 Tax=Meloidogyne javanica TaxID=6303 RepID=A0A915N187_MELJA
MSGASPSPKREVVSSRRRDDDRRRSERDLRKLFGEYGEIESVQIVYDRFSGRSRGFGFVYFTSTKDATRAKDHLMDTVIDGMKVFTNGITNKIFCVCNGEEKEDKLIFRVFGAGSDKIIDREFELENFERLSKNGLAAPVYAKFENGLVYGYLPGECVSIKSVREPFLLDKLNNKIHFIDYEYAGPNPQLFDIANHLCEYAGLTFFLDTLGYSSIKSFKNSI